MKMNGPGIEVVLQLYKFRNSFAIYLQLYIRDFRCNCWKKQGICWSKYRDLLDYFDKKDCRGTAEVNDVFKIAENFIAEIWTLSPKASNIEYGFFIQLHLLPYDCDTHWIH